MDHAVKHEFVDFGDNTDVARHQFANFRGFFTLKNHRVRNFDRLLVVVDEQLIVTAQGTLVNTEHTDLADIRVINHLEDMGNKRKVRIGLQFDVVSVFICEERSISFRRIREVTNHHVDEIINTGAGLAGDKADRDDVSFTKRLCQRGVQRARIGFAFFKVFFHSGIVDFHNLFDKGTMDFGHAHEVGFTFVFGEAVDHARAVVGGQVNRHDFLTESFSELFDETRQI